MYHILIGKDVNNAPYAYWGCLHCFRETMSSNYMLIHNYDKYPKHTYHPPCEVDAYQLKRRDDASGPHVEDAIHVVLFDDCPIHKTALIDKLELDFTDPEYDGVVIKQIYIHSRHKLVSLTIKGACIKDDIQINIQHISTVSFENCIPVSEPTSIHLRIFSDDILKFGSNDTMEEMKPNCEIEILRPKGMAKFSLSFKVDEVK
jgi:hypothetical protein